MNFLDRNNVFNTEMNVACDMKFFGLQKATKSLFFWVPDVDAQLTCSWCWAGSDCGLPSGGRAFIKFTYRISSVCSLWSNSWQSEERQTWLRHTQCIKAMLWSFASLVFSFKFSNKMFPKVCILVVTLGEIEYYSKSNYQIFYCSITLC